jgi:stalled ribosome alternative rescue factor ArfA
MRQKLTLSIDETLIRSIKVQAVMENRDVSDITEDLYREYLDRQKKGKGKSKS